MGGCVGGWEPMLEEWEDVVRWESVGEIGEFWGDGRVLGRWESVGDI